MRLQNKQLSHHNLSVIHDSSVKPHPEAYILNTCLMNRCNNDKGNGNFAS